MTKLNIPHIEVAFSLFQFRHLLLVNLVNYSCNSVVVLWSVNKIINEISNIISIQVRVMQLKQEQDKCRVLEEALNVLAKEHHELEQSMASHLSGSPPSSRRRNSSMSCKFFNWHYDSV